MRSLLHSILRLWSRLLLMKYTPLVIGVTGSVGKTSTKDAIVTVLQENKIAVRGSIKNYNNELGVPLTIIGASAGGRSLWQWMRALARAKRLFFFRDRTYPRVLVLEMGADRPGDIRHLATMTRPTIGIVTTIAPAHVATLGSLDRIAREKSALVAALPKDGVAILNGDDAAVAALKERTKARVVTYGFEASNDIRAIEVQTTAFLEDDQTKIDAVSFKIAHNGSAVPVRIPGTLGAHVVYAALAAAAVGLEQGLHLVEIASALQKYVPPPGRLRVLDGIKHTTLLDDTYNASPRSTNVAIEALAQLPKSAGASTWAVMGDMLELGGIAEEEHRKVGAHIAEHGIQMLVTVGEQSRDIDRGAKEAHMPEECIIHFADAAEAGKFVQGRLKRGDVLLVKGSQGVRMEKIVKELMAEPLQAKDLLVRQDSGWK